MSYAGTFTNPWQSFVIRTVEWCTGKITLLRRIREFERMGPATGQEFWAQARGLMRIDLLTPEQEIANIPESGPVVVVANHPHGLVDGMMLAELIGARRNDYKILTRSLLTGVDEVSQYMIPVPFPHEEDSFQKSLDMRKEAMQHLADGGVIVVFPSGAVAASETMWGPAIEGEWNPFTAKMIQRSGATVVPVKFPGQNSRPYQIANQISATLRQGLLIHEVAHAFGKPQRPIIGEAIEPETLKEKGKNPRDFMAWLRERTMGLKG
ncbi:MAG: lysophospholipid acyltransferase family protein [Rhodobacteraceae bacterium]|nr:lysophospholipid acyltransferase family protein [Paracoccaceae bacterium]